NLRAFATLILLALGLQLSLAGVANASGSDFTLNWVAATPSTYNHRTGVGGEFDGGGSAHVVNSLTGKDFFCGDRVVFFTKVDVAAGAVGAQTIQIDFSFDTQPSGQPGVGFRDLLVAKP